MSDRSQVAVPFSFTTPIQTLWSPVVQPYDLVFSGAFHVVARGAAQGVPLRGEQRRHGVRDLHRAELLAGGRKVHVVPELQVAGLVGLAAHLRESVWGGFSGPLFLLPRPRPRLSAPTAAIA